MKDATRHFYKRQLLGVLVHIQQHLDRRLSLDELAGLACLSPFHFHHVFSGMVGESLGSHVRRLRLERAAWQLKLGEHAVIEVAHDAGYRTHESFTRAFHAAFGLSPREYRRRHRASTWVAAPSHVHFHPRARIADFRPATPRRSEDSPMKVTVKRLPERRVAFVRHIGPYDTVAAAWDRLLPFLGKEGWLGGDAEFLGICHDDPAVTRADRIRYDACVTVDARFQPVDDIGVQVIAAGDYAILTHQGPYSRLGDSYARLLGEWLPRSGRRLRLAPSFETYLNSPENTDPEDLLVDLHAPLESK